MALMLSKKKGGNAVRGTITLNSRGTADNYFAIGYDYDDDIGAIAVGDNTTPSSDATPLFSFTKPAPAASQYGTVTVLKDCHAYLMDNTTKTWIDKGVVTANTSLLTALSIDWYATGNLYYIMLK